MDFMLTGTEQIGYKRERNIRGEVSLEICTMRLILTSIIVAVACANEVAAHGYVPLLRINGKDVAGWDIAKGTLILRFAENIRYNSLA